MTDARRALLLLLAALVPAAACGSDSTGDDTDAGGGGPPTLPGTPGQWTWIDVPGTQCMNGSATGFGVNLGTSSDLVIYMEGGGACFNDFTCASVAHPNGFTGADLASAAAGLMGPGLFDRAATTNPLRDATFLFFPYCSGDIFAGSAPSGFGGRVQVGYRNVGAYMDVIVPQAGPVRRVVVTGSSAGGFGALYNYDRIAALLPGRPIFLLDDSGPPLPDQWLTPCLQSQIRQLWNLADSLPADCAECTGSDGGGLVNAIPYLASHHPDQRLGLVIGNADGVIRSFYGFGYPTCSSLSPMPAADFTAGLDALRSTVLAGHDNFRMFTIASSAHVWLFDDLGNTMAGGQTLSAWLNAMLDGGAWDHAGQ